MDAPERLGGEDLDPNPKPFVPSALSGCTGMDIISILCKSGKEIQDLSITISGEISKQHPIVYTSIHIVYDFKGNEDFKQDALNAVLDSQERFCGVSHMLKMIMPVTWDVNYNGERIFSNKPVLMVV